VDVFGDVTVDFGVVQPSPTPTPRYVLDPFYEREMAKVLLQLEQWEDEFGKEQARQMIVDWLNRELTDPSPPEGIVEARIDDTDNTVIWLIYDDGIMSSIGTSYDCLMMASLDDITTLKNQNFSEDHQSKNIVNVNTPIASSELDNIDNILILAPYAWQIGSDAPNVGLEDLKEDLEEVYKDKITVRITEQIDFTIDYTKKDDKGYNPCYLFLGGWDDIVSPQDFEEMGNYELVYYYGHGNNCLAIPYIEDDDETKTSKLEQWVIDHAGEETNVYDPTKGTWSWHCQTIRFSDYFSGAPHEYGKIKMLILQESFFEQLDSTNSFQNSIVILFACHSFVNLDDDFSSAKVFIGVDRTYVLKWGRAWSYYFFHYMMCGAIEPNEVPNYTRGSGEPPKPNIPMHLKEAFDTLSVEPYKVNPDPQDYKPGYNAQDCELKIYPSSFDTKYYLAQPIEIIIQEE